MLSLTLYPVPSPLLLTLFFLSHSHKHTSIFPCLELYHQCNWYSKVHRYKVPMTTTLCKKHVTNIAKTSGDSGETEAHSSCRKVLKAIKKKQTDPAAYYQSNVETC